MRNTRCACCDHEITQEEFDFVKSNWEGRMSEYCEQCAWQRCDVRPSSIPCENEEGKKK